MTQRAFDIGPRPQLALDHDLFASIDGATERLFAVTKHPTPVLAPSAPWEAPGRGALRGPLHAQHLETGRIRLWYTSFDIYPGRGRDTGLHCLSVAESDDGIAFERPSLGPTEWGGTADNNVNAIRGPGHSHGTIDSLRIDPDEDPAFRFKATTWLGRDADGYGRHGVAYSPDGLRWRHHDGPPASRLKRAGDVVSGASLRDWFDPDRSPPHPASKYAILPKMQVPIGRFDRRSFAIMFSDDAAPVPCSQFDDPKLVFAVDERDDDMAEARLAGRHWRVISLCLLWSARGSPFPGVAPGAPCTASVRQPIRAAWRTACPSRCSRCARRRHATRGGGHRS